MDRLITIIQTLAILAFVIFLAQISLRFLNKYTLKQNKIIKVIERVGVNNNSSLAIVEIFGLYYLMSFTQNDNSILKELNKDEVTDYLLEMDKQKLEKDKDFLKSLKSLSINHKAKGEGYWNEGKN